MDQLRTWRQILDRAPAHWSIVLRRTVILLHPDLTEDRNRGNMLRAAAFADPAGPGRWSLDQHVVELHPMNDLRSESPAARSPQQDFVP